MLLEKLTAASGVSGNEREVRKLIIKELEGFVDDIKVDRMGNLMVTKSCKDSQHHIALVAHMDEVGLIVKGIDNNGLIKFAPIGGLDARILISKVVYIGDNKIPGVIGAKAIHLQKPDERKKALSVKDLYIDIGCSNQSEAEKLVSPGDYITFNSQFVTFGKNRIKAKALDDRAGCGVLIELLKRDLPINVTGVFTVQEEVGLRGAIVAANQLNVDLAIIVEGTTCSDVTDIELHMQVTALDKGTAVSVMDRTSVYNRKWIDAIIETAKENDLPWQFRRSSFGGNDAGMFHLSQEGTQCLSLAVPCRYIHSPVSVLSLDDYNNTIKLIEKFLVKLSKGGLL
ncbi:M42 family metallopeptidase [Alkaliphilus serpentinus]|uniref:M42 family metallopeptidase n=1 Tax=Alkaliphilus serpentinus TaxID=1482731 RepID=A0A833HL49_9FIRM|nr:M42 family metallopeptidase [Alkaliphilus serpentinus]KAB3524944.1 M42 family metallopeptidase [Alkaliphilus serpentinus]